MYINLKFHRIVRRFPKTTMNCGWFWRHMKASQGQNWDGSVTSVRGFITKTTAIWYSKANSERVTLPQTQSKCLTKKDHHKIKIIMQQRTDRMWHPPYFSGQKSWNSLNRMALFEETHGVRRRCHDPHGGEMGGNPESMAPRWENTRKVFRPKKNHYQYGTLESKQIQSCFCLVCSMFLLCGIIYQYTFIHIKCYKMYMLDTPLHILEV